MNGFALRLLLFLAAICGVPRLQANVQAQETQRQKQEQGSQQNQYRDQSQSLQENQQQHELQDYRGKISTKHGDYFLEVAYSRASYLLQDTHEAKKFLDKKVRVTGWLDADKDILHVTTMATTP
jgi:hypothetical protein